MLPSSYLQFLITNLAERFCTFLILLEPKVLGSQCELPYRIPGRDEPDPFKVFLILGTGKQILHQESTVGLSANIADMWIPFQSICNCYTEVSVAFNSFQYCTFKVVRRLDYISPLFCQLHHVASTG